MRARPLHLLTLPRLILAGLALAGAACSSNVIGGGGGIAGSGGDGSIPSSSSSSGTPTTSSSSSGSVSSSSGFVGPCADPTVVGLPPSACTPAAPSCGADKSLCLSTTHAYGAPTFGLRIAHIALTAPKALTQGIVKSVFDGSTAPNQPACNLMGSATFNWLLRFDTAAGTLTTGAAKPVSSPGASYAFIHETLDLAGSAFPVAPVVLSAPLDATCDISSSAGDVLLPFFQDAAATTFTLFPLRALRFFDTHVTPDHDCIGAYDAAHLSPADACLPDDQHPAFVDGGSFAAFISLEDADAVFVPPLSQSLCVLLSGDASTYGTNGKCKRDANNVIVLQGDWCSATNQAATAGCADALRFAGSFAASGVAIQ